ncbi:MAG: hypothetical protein E7379_02450 [Clostridiales bacterium]|nr:hypothetical protein [Clostridiales bacterium]
MHTDEYRLELQRLQTKLDKNYGQNFENLFFDWHKMFVEGDKNFFDEIYNDLKEEIITFEKVELIDYWKMENGRNDQTW